MGAGNSKRNPAMTPLCFRMIEDMKSAGLASGTQTLYLDAVFRLAGHYHRSPDQLSEAEVRAWLLGLRERGVALGTFKTNYGGIRFLYRRTLEKDCPLFGEKKDPSAEAAASANRSARQPGPGASGPRQQSRTSDMPGPDVWLRLADQRGGRPGNWRDRQRQHAVAYHRQGRQGAARAITAASPRRFARPVADAPPSALAVSQA